VHFEEVDQGWLQTVLGSWLVTVDLSWLQTVPETVNLGWLQMVRGRRLIWADCIQGITRDRESVRRELNSCSQRAGGDLVGIWQGSGCRKSIEASVPKRPGQLPGFLDICRPVMPMI
jgi:hypothetical protein